MNDDHFSSDSHLQGTFLSERMILRSAHPGGHRCNIAICRWKPKLKKCPNYYLSGQLSKPLAVEVVGGEESGPETLVIGAPVRYQKFALALIVCQNFNMEQSPSMM
jgi:hypothetical protein